MRYFERRMEDGFRVDPEEVAAKDNAADAADRSHQSAQSHRRSISTRLRCAPSEKSPKRNSARVLVDEVYLEAMYEQRPQSAIHLGEHFLVTSSLTKAFGLSGLRCGWVLANPELTDRMWHINDLYGVNAAHPAELLSVIALDHLERVEARAKKLLDANRPVLDAFLHVP